MKAISQFRIDGPGQQFGLLWLCLLLSAMCPAALAQGEDGPQTGIFTTHYTQTSPHSAPDRMSAVTRWTQQQMPEYDIADHTFQLVVPEAYDGTEAYGLLVFIHPSNTIALDRFFGRQIADVLAEHKLIWVSFSDAGNPVMPNIRLGLALDAAHNVAQQYNIDEDRVYVSGMSGGGRMTCMAGIYYPQVFTGAIPIVGSVYFRDVPFSHDPEMMALLLEPPPAGATVWRRVLVEPAASRLRRMVTDQRWVLLAGELDFNMPEMRAHFEHGFGVDGFEHTHYLEVPQMGHSYPATEWMGRAIELLDQPLTESANQPPADERTQRVARSRLDSALRVLERDVERGQMLLERLIRDMPNTEAAQEAREHLGTLRVP